MCDLQIVDPGVIRRLLAPQIPSTSGGQLLPIGSRTSSAACTAGLIRTPRRLCAEDLRPPLRVVPRVGPYVALAVLRGLAVVRRKGFGVRKASPAAWINLPPAYLVASR
jgi:hypothetical protein